jgi:predicted lactoylglutathione lyase
VFKSVFFNLPIANLKRSVEFFGQLGFEFNPQFTDESSTCMIISDTIYAMLCEHPKYQGFIQDKKIADAQTSEVILSFAADSADEVKRISEKAFELGARKVNELENHGFMISWGFEDLDGHLWDIFWMDPNFVMPQQSEEK